ncbi:MAG: hypothetical protein IH631_00220 [Candidatus Thorarchaeota archaeon]|nr:hypothetical protein [Candidatus Thorarchaeota archaeon]
MKFPQILAENLNKEEVEVPNGLQGSPKLLIVPFQRWHQGLVDSWVPFLESVIKDHPNFDFYELPTIRRMNFVYRRFLDGGMRAGIPSLQTRRRTITLYIDKEPFKEALEIPNEDSIHLFLVDSEGNIMWRDEGGVTEDKAQALLDTFKQIHSATDIQ